MISQRPELTEVEQIIATPTLIKKLRRLFGDMSNTQNILNGLDLRETTEKALGRNFDREHDAPCNSPGSRRRERRASRQARGGGGHAARDPPGRDRRTGDAEDALGTQSDTGPRVADRVWTAVEQAQAEVALREREAELSRAYRIAGIGSVKVEVRDGNFVADRSPEYLAVHGLTPQDRDNSHEAWLHRLHPEDREKADRTFRECLADGRKLYQSEYRIMRQNDSATRWIKVLAEIERDASGAPLRLFGTHLDVTESRLHEAALRTSEIRYRRLFEAAHDGVLILDPATRKIVDANPFMTTLLGYPHDQLIGMELYQIGFLADAQASRDMFQTLTATRQVRYENLPLQNQGADFGKSRWWPISTTRTADPSFSATSAT